MVTNGNCNGIQVNVRTSLNVARMHLQNVLASIAIGISDPHLSIESSSDRGVQNVGAIGGRNDYNCNVIVFVEPIHFGQQLVQGLFAFVVRAATTTQQSSTRPCLGQSVEFIDKDNCRATTRWIGLLLLRPQC